MPIIANVTGELSIFNLSGTVGSEDVISIIDDHFSNYPTKDSLWDISLADISGISPDGYKLIAEAAKRHVENRGSNTRTVIIAPGIAEQIVIKFYKTMSEIIGSPTSYKIVASRKEAYAWLNSDKNGLLQED